MLRDENLSAYGPIRLRNSPWWMAAKVYGQKGWITRDGQVADRLHDRIDDQLIDPLMAMLGEGSKTGEVPPEIIGSLIVKFHALHDWVPLLAQYELAGRQIFDLHDRLTDMLLHTDLGETTLEDLHLPYDAFYVRFGAQNAIKVPFDEGLFELLDGAFVAIAPWGDDGGVRIKFGFTTVHEDGSGVTYPGLFFDFLPEERSMPVSAAIEAALARRLAMTDEATSDMERALIEWYHVWVEDSADMFRAGSALLVNALFYLESVRGTLPTVEPGRDTPPDRQAKWMQTAPLKRDKQRSALSTDGYALVRLMGREAIEHHNAGAGHETVRLHWRRGHWRQQRHGAGYALVKRIWIKPVLVGKGDVSEGAPVPGHVYVAPPSNTVQ